MAFFQSNTWNRIRYTLYTPVYDLFISTLAPKRKRSIELLKLNTDDKVLILGAGTGLDLPFLTHVKDITAIDITPAMVNKLKHKADSLNLSVNALVMDGQKLDFADQSFDAVILHLILAVIPNPIDTIKEADRVLKPNGRAVVFDKFLKATSAGSVRKGINIFSKILATDLNRRIEDIISVVKLKIVHDEPALMNGLFRIILLKKE